MPSAPTRNPTMRGDADLAALGAVLAEPARTQILLALADGRALPASVLADEAGTAASTASGHLSRLLDSGLLAVRQQGRHRYYELAGPQVGEMIETLARLAPGGDGRHHPERAGRDRLSGPGRDLHYELTPAGDNRLRELGVALPEHRSGGRSGIPLRYCVDWTEQAHHLSGAVGRALASWMLEQGWLERLPRSRALRVTAAGARGLSGELGVEAELAGEASG